VPGCPRGVLGGLSSLSDVEPGLQVVKEYRRRKDELATLTLMQEHVVESKATLESSSRDVHRLADFMIESKVGVGAASREVEQFDLGSVRDGWL
jgi:hypothetical protein